MPSLEADRLAARRSFVALPGTPYETSISAYQDNIETNTLSVSDDNAYPHRRPSVCLSQMTL
jgi:hypothetical protein